MALLRLLLNIVRLVFGGLSLALAYVVAGLICGSVRRPLRLEAADLLRPAARLRDPAGPRACGVLVGHVDDRQPAEVLLGLDERSVREREGAAGGVGAEGLLDLLVEPTG